MPDPSAPPPCPPPGIRAAAVATLPRGDLALGLGLAALTLLSRVPFRARLLPSWDAVQFALALREYDVVKHQPHPPGYILYVALARAVDGVVGDATETLTGLAIAASAATVFLTYRLAWTLYGRSTALVAAAGLAASPLFWIYGVLPLSYAVEAALATGVAALVIRMRGGRARDAVWAALALGVAGGVRQSLLVLLLPLWLGMAWVGLRRWRAILAGGAVLALTSAAWFVPMVWLTGGFGRYVDAGLELFESTVRATSIVGLPGEWRVNAIGLLEALVLGLGVGLPALAALGVAGLRRGRGVSGHAGFFALWILPPLVVYTSLHFGQHGYLLMVLPAFYVLLARGLVPTAGRPAARLDPPALAWAGPAAAVAVMVLAHVAFFVSARPIALPGSLSATPGTAGWLTALRAHYRFHLWPNTAQGLREQEAVLGAYLAAIRRDFSPTDTVLVTELGNPRSYPWFRHLTYYLPEFTAFHLRLGRYSPGYLSSRQIGAMVAVGSAEIFLPPTARRLVWVVDHWNPLLPRPSGLRERPLPHGRWLYVLELDRRAVEHAGYRLTPLVAVARLR